MLSLSLRTRALQGRPLVAIALFCSAGLLNSSARATIDVGPVTVNSIGHAYLPPGSTISGFGYVSDYLIDQNQAGGGGATLGNVSLDLDTDTQVAVTVSAPAGKYFQVTVPAAAHPIIDVDFGWETPNADLGTGLSSSVAWQGLVGTAPTFSDSSTIGNDNQYFDFEAQSSQISSSFQFSAVTITETYSPRSTGDGTIEYSPFDPASGTDYTMNFTYITSLSSDPGRFITIVPEPSCASLLGLGAAMKLATRRRRAR